MPQLSVRVEGLDRLRTGLTGWANTLAPVCRDTIYAALERALKKSPGWLGGSAYTTPDAGYVRTGNLGRSVSVEQNGATTTIKNSAYSTRGFQYGGLVLGDADGGGQKAVYTRNGWVTLRAAVDEQVRQLTVKNGELDGALQDSAKANEL